MDTRTHVAPTSLACVTSVVALSFFPSTGCAIRRITPPPDMTTDKAIRIIEDYEKHARDELVERLQHWRFLTHVGTSFKKKRFSANPDSFTHVDMISIPSANVGSRAWGFREIRYSELGDFDIVYSVYWPAWNRNPFATFAAAIFAPMVLSTNHTKPEVAPFELTGDLLQGKTLWLSLVPLWFFGTPLWVKTREEEFLEALVYMKDSHSPTTARSDTSTKRINETRRTNGIRQEKKPAAGTKDVDPVDELDEILREIDR